MQQYPESEWRMHSIHPCLIHYLVHFIPIHPQEGVLIVLLLRDALLHDTAKDRDGRCLAQS